MESPFSQSRKRGRESHDSQSRKRARLLRPCRCNYCERRVRWTSPRGEGIVCFYAYSLLQVLSELDGTLTEEAEADILEFLTDWVALFRGTSTR